jgi:hypothetical protein
MVTFHAMLSRLTALLVLLAPTGCASAAWLFGPPEDVPTEAPNARILRTLSPPAREEVFPPPRAFESYEWVTRVVCPLGETPGWKRTGRRGLVDTYAIECPGQPDVAVQLDTGNDAPPAPAPLRLLGAAGAAKFREAVQAMEKKDPKAALEALDAARRADPGEVVYRRERSYVLYALDRFPEALIAADEVVDEGRPDPLALKYRALAARALGLRDEVLGSLSAITRVCPKTHPLYAEAVCAQGLFTLSAAPDEGQRLLAEGCALGHQACCDFVEKRRQTHPAEPEPEEDEGAEQGS